MKYTFLILLSLFSINLLQAQNASIDEMDLQKDGRWYKVNTIEPFNGTVEGNWASGKKKSRVEIKNGLQEGKTTQWYKTGEKRSVAIYKSGQKNGEETQYYPTGNKKLVINFQNDIPNGMVQEWYEDEAKKSQGIYQNGREQAEHIWWYANGDLDQKVIYQNGKANGLVQHWYLGGQQKLKATYAEGLPNGNTKEWYKNGQLKAEGNYINGKENGDILSYSTKGLLLEIASYKLGELIQVQDFRSGAIKAGLASFIQVFNEKESFFKVEIKGQSFVRDRSGYDITYNVDGKLLQMITKPVSEGIKGEGLSNSKDSLLNFIKNEKDFVEENTGKKIQTESKIGKTSNGLTYIHWWFDTPTQVDATSKRSIKREHYLSLICHKQILSLYSVVTNQDHESAISALLKNTANEIELSNKPIDLNLVRQPILRK